MCLPEVIEKLPLEQEKFILLSMIYELFDYYIESSWENNEIQKYIEHEHKQPDGEDIYDKFKHIYEQCHSYGEEKRKQL
jgi:hypothetical protein